MPRFLRPREGSHLKQRPGHWAQNQGFAFQPRLPPANQPGPRREMMFSAPFSLSLANSLKVRIVVSVILLSYFPKLRSATATVFSAHHALPREDGCEGKKHLASHRALLAHSSSCLGILPPSQQENPSEAAGEGGTLFDGWEMCHLQREGTCCQSHISTDFSCTFISSQDSPLCPDGKGGPGDSLQGGL